MARPPLCRHIAAVPNATCFAPQGIPVEALPEARLALEELEALRLADAEGLTAIEAAERMRVSRHTFGRILTKARKTVATALCQGQMLRVKGGHYALSADITPPAGFEGIIAVPSTGPGLSSPVAERFGRAGGFILVRLPEATVTYLDNTLSQDNEHEAGLAATSLLQRAGVSVVLGGGFGVLAFRALREAGLSVCLNVNGTVLEAVQRFCRGELSFAAGPNRI